MTTVNITVSNDADFYRTFQYVGVGGTPINITGAAMEMKLRRNASDKAAVLRLGTDTGEIAIINGATGTFTVRITQDKLERIGLGEFDHSNVISTVYGKRQMWEGVLTNNAGAAR